MMAGFGNGTRTRRHPRSRGRTWSRTGPDRATLGIIGVICAIAGFFVLGIILGPIAIVTGWLAMGRSWTGSRPVTALVAVVLGAIDTLLAVIWLAGAASPGSGLF
ncbi:small hydrophobic protein [Streptomyces sp. NPDC001536]|uniref:small hydrophobic protein n=1 Tax=Streptomyces sp. NPDC001536 TaxID=3364583 RepID=UPI0036CF5974